MAKKVQLQSNPKKWEVVDGVEVLVDQEIHDLDPMTDSSCVEIEGHRTLEETINQDNMFTPEITEIKVMTEVGGVYHDNVVDGAYEQAILYGNTQVNVSEAVTTSSKYVPLPFTSFQGNEKKVDSPKSNYTCQVAPLIKGVTMVNLAQETSLSVVSGSGVWVNNVKPSTKYTLILTYTIQNSQKGLIIQSYNNTTYLENTKQITGLEQNVQLTFTTHESTNAVRICNPDGYGGETIQLDDIMVLEGDMTDLDIPFFKGMRSVELVRPLTNLFTDDLVPETMGSTVTNSGGTVTVTSTTITQWASARYYLDLKPNTKYVIMWDSLTFTQTASGTDYIISVCENDTIFSHMGNKFTTLRSIIFNTGNKSAISIRIHATTSNSETGTTTVKGLRVFEWDDSLRTLDLQSIGYFSGTKNVCQHVFKTESKNLYPYRDVKFTNDYVGWCDAKGTTGMYGDIGQKSKVRFLLKKGTYTFTVGSSTNVNPIYIVSDKEEFISDLEGNKVFTLEQDTYCTLRVKTIEANVATTVTNIQIERGDTATAYSEYHGRAFIADGKDEIILRSLPNGVCDTYNLQTGELIQRIGEMTFDGSNDEQWSRNTFSNNEINVNINRSIFDITVDNISKNNDGKDDTTQNNRLPNMQGTYLYSYSSDRGVEGVGNPSGRIRIGLVRSRLSSDDVNGLKLWLQSNPITVQYELETPIIKTITTHDRTYNPITNSSVSIGNNLGAFAYTTKDHMMIVGNLSPVPPIVESITELPYKMRLKPNTTYTIKCLRGNSQTMSFDLGGTVYNDTTPISGLYEALIKTPVSQLSHDYLKISGTGFAQKIVVVEGDIRGTELPYFEGMCNAKMPIVKNIGKNLCDSEFIYGTMGSNNGVFADVKTAIIAKDITKVRPGKSFIMYNTSNYAIAIAAYDKNKQFLRTISSIFSGTKFTLGTDVYYVRPRTPNTGDSSNCYNDINTKIYLYEHEEGMDTTLQDYKENSVYAVQGEIPITSEMIEQGGFSMANSNDGSYEKSKYDGNNTIRLRSKDLISVKPNTTYGILNTLSTLCYNVYQWDGNRQFLEGLSKYYQPGSLEVFTTSPNTHYIHFLMSKPNANNTISLSEYDWSQFHMYELDSTINLRSLPNGVKDELNLLTGEYIQRVGEVVLDGSEGWMVSENFTSTFNSYYSVIDNSTYKPTFINDKLMSLYGADSLGVKQGFYMGNYIGQLAPFISTSLATVDELKSWLQSNPIKVQYELAEPIISYPRIVSNNQEREVGVKLPNGVCNTYNPSTGITTVRVGFIEFDGSEDWTAVTTDGELQQAVNGAIHMYGVWTAQPLPNARPANLTTDSRIPGVCDSFSFKNKALDSTNEEFYFISHTGRFNMNIARTKLTGSNVSHLKEYLSQNPIKLWYELKYPQIQPDIVLPNGVHDEYNPETGVYTKRVGFIEFDGSADENWDTTYINVPKTNTIVFFCFKHTPLAKIYSDKGVGYPIVTNQFEYCTVDLGQKIGGGDKMDIEGAYMAYDGNVCFSINKSKLTTYGLTDTMLSNTLHKEEVLQIIRQYLAQNTLQAWYELATPIIYQLTPYSALPTPYAYEDGYIIMESVYPETTLPPEFNYKLLANRIGQVMQNNRKLQEHTTRLSNLEVIIIEATIESLFNREMQRFELELMDIQLTEL